jgi:hypothetical protein
VLSRAGSPLVGQRASIPGVPVGFHLAPHPTHRILAPTVRRLQRLQGLRQRRGSRRRSSRRIAGCLRKPPRVVTAFGLERYLLWWNGIFSSDPAQTVWTLDTMRFGIAMALCLLSTQVFAEQISLRCHGHSMKIDDASEQSFTFTVIIDPDRSLVMDIAASDGVATPNTSNGSIVETIQFTETTISANQRVWRHQEKDHLAAPPAGEKRLKINRVTGRFDLKDSNEGLKYVNGTCATLQ